MLLPSSVPVPVQFQTEISLIITVTPTHPIHPTRTSIHAFFFIRIFFIRIIRLNSDKNKNHLRIIFRLRSCCGTFKSCFPCNKPGTCICALCSIDLNDLITKQLRIVIHFITILYLLLCCSLGYFLGIN